MIDFSDVTDALPVFNYFLEISKIPHGSGNTSGIADYLVDFAKERKLEYYRDKKDNVIIKKTASKGYEGRPTVIIQGHTDMVAEKLPGLAKNMEKDGLDLYRDGMFLRAEGTTLGGDDGVAVAYALALLDDDSIPHPDIEALFTSDEEIGLLGAVALDTSKLNGKILINIDSDDEGIFTVGCAGGRRCDFSLPVSYGFCEDKKYKISVSGLLGGHSGVEIDKGRANAIKILAEVLHDIEGIRIADFCGGNADNAIPRDCYALVCTNSDIVDFASSCEDAYREIYGESDPDIKIMVEETDFDNLTLTKESTDALLSLITDIKTGVYAMSKSIKGLPETSANVGIARLDTGIFRTTVSVRSAVGKEKEKLVSSLDEISAKYGAEFSTRGDYPAWEYKEDSHIREIACKVYKEMYGNEPRVIVIHAGLECGIFSDKIEGLDCISLGPDNYDIHTTEEHLSIPSVARVWEYLKKVLAEI